VFVNMGVWLLEQIVCIEFELLSVSYIISEMFLFMLCLLMQGGRMIEVQSEAMNAAAEHGGDTSNKSHNTQKPCEKAETRSLDEQCAYFVAQRASLTPTERVIYDFYLAGKTTKEIMAELNIKENTLKYHNKNIYSKLGVSSRKQLLMIASMVNE